jgi:hypothetical protein
VGPPIPDDCNACTQIVCGSYPNCCTTGWTADCVILATFLCGPCAS